MIKAINNFFKDYIFTAIENDEIDYILEKYNRDKDRDWVIDNYWNNPLAYICRLNKINILKELIKLNIDLNILTKNTKATPLYIASHMGHYSIAKILLENGADANMTCYENWSPIYTATTHNNYNIVELLLKHGASPNILIKNGTSNLIYAIYDGNTNIARLLIENGADVNIIWEDITALFAATKFGNPYIVKLLLENNADPNITSNGLTLMNFATRLNKTSIVEILKSYNKTKAENERKYNVYKNFQIFKDIRKTEDILTPYVKELGLATLICDYKVQLECVINEN